MTTLVKQLWLWKDCQVSTLLLREAKTCLAVLSGKQENSMVNPSFSATTVIYPFDPLSLSGRSYCVQSICCSSLQLSSFGLSPWGKILWSCPVDSGIAGYIALANEIWAVVTNVIVGTSVCSTISLFPLPRDNVPDGGFSTCLDPGIQGDYSRATASPPWTCCMS